MALKALIVVAAAVEVWALAPLVSGCGSSRPAVVYRPGPTADCLRTTRPELRVSTDPDAVDVVARSADGGAVVVGNAMNEAVIAFGSSGAETRRLEEAYRLWPVLRPSVVGNAVVEWSYPPTSEQRDAVERCLAP